MADTRTKLLSVPLGLSLLFFTGCSEEEASKNVEETVKIAEKKTEEGANKAGELALKAKEQTSEAQQTIKEKTPQLVQNMKDSYQESEQKLKDSTLQKGDKAKTVKDGFLALTPEAYDELYQLIEVNDLEGISNIEKNEQVVEISKDYEVEVLEREIRRTKVKVIDSGKEGYLPTNLLKPVN